MTFPYKYGALPAQFPGVLRDLTFYSAGPLPKAPPSIAVPAFSNWDMLGNDQYGDCGVAGLQHLMEATSVITSESEDWPSAQQAVEFYLTYTNGQDSGVVLSQYLAYVHQHGYYGHDIDGFAPVAVHDVPTLQTAVYLYGGAYCGIAVTDQMEQAFGAGQPWDSATTGGNVVGGHCVPVLGYDDNSLYICTWGKIQPVSYPAWHNIASEAWAVIDSELVAHNGDGRGISLAALQADLNKLAS